jgi:hypothetical protein
MAVGDALLATIAAGELGWPSIDAPCAMPLIVVRLELGDRDGARDALRRAPAGVAIGQSWFEGAVALAGFMLWRCIRGLVLRAGLFAGRARARAARPVG